MTDVAQARPAVRSLGRRMLNKVPEVTVYFWLIKVLCTTVGETAADYLNTNLGFGLTGTTEVMGAVLVMVLFLQFRARRYVPGIYWLAILFTFALGTAAGDLTAEQLNVGYLNSVLVFGSLIAIVAAAHFRLRLNAVVAFWIAYVLTRPLGASIGDYMSQPTHAGGLNLGTTGTSAIFLTAILALVIYLSITKTDQPTALEAA